MPQSSLGYTDGAGRLLDSYQRSISSNTVEEQVVVVAPPYVPTYVVPVTTEISTATANSHLIQVMGSAANRLELVRLQVFQSTGATSSTLALLSLLRLTTAGTGGTAFTPNPINPVDAATTATAMTLPSAKGSEGVALWSGSMLMLTAAAVVTAGVDPCILDINWEQLRAKSPEIAAGLANGAALKLLTAVAVGKVLITLTFAERFWS